MLAQTQFLGAMLTVVYVKVIIAACTVARGFGLPVDISRKIIHIGACTFILFWPWFDDSNNLYILNITVPLVYTIQLAYKGLILKDPNDEDVRNMSRSGKPIDLCKGPLMFTCVMCYVGAFCFNREVGVAIMGALVGDGVAPLFGSRLGRHWFGPFPGQSSRKSIEGSLGVFLGTVAGTGVMLSFLQVADNGIELLNLVKLGGLVTVVEAISPDEIDNLLIPLAVRLVYW